ncbi:hypothetical protein [Amycolatopsis vastitatis]|uniref:Uncharacterized protein n=1 Tax=Amycolatopsis vastitatis TaxID=1905142 RepID=A0A229TEH6_9PSEU|nr:hypothetical protein [Amycolatopsis vastitatis]OXM69665.1 hypothetical protein CF165_09150 [Amycolatopsis vastitatis]
MTDEPAVKLSASLPAGDRNGLPAIASALVEQPGDVHAAVVLLRAREIRTNTRTGAALATAEFLAIEPCPASSPDAATLHRLLREHYGRRTGNVELPLDQQDEEDNQDPAELWPQPGPEFDSDVDDPW